MQEERVEEWACDNGGTGGASIPATTERGPATCLLRAACKAGPAITSLPLLLGSLRRLRRRAPDSSLRRQRFSLALSAGIHRCRR
jgi:hypothetical protein